MSCVFPVLEQESHGFPRVAEVQGLIPSHGFFVVKKPWSMLKIGIPSHDSPGWILVGSWWIDMFDTTGEDAHFEHDKLSQMPVTVNDKHCYQGRLAMFDSTTGYPTIHKLLEAD